MFFMKINLSVNQRIKPESATVRQLFRSNKNETAVYPTVANSGLIRTPNHIGSLTS